MNLQVILLTACVAVAFSSPVELEEKLRNLFAGEKELSLKGLGVATRGTGSYLSTSERDTILQLHNDARNNVQPTASNMQQMTWSSELASVAQTYANKCVWSHNSARSSQASSFYYVGENLYVTTSSYGYLEKGVASWDNEKKDYDYASNSCSGVCGHYTQVVWADSTKLGCAVGSCPSMTNLPSYFQNVKFVVCNYGPGGNYNGVKPYEQGTPASVDNGSSGTSGGCK
ncbi:GLIPR1-like protein 1,Glioma pathogenesis-related protein 1 [Mytilus edulis]|uniref:GLIPR1-like protein 1,Glioma pathogenesis-related protein 1 n=1 Tax=Mytilus edulis TaxID=6550 RepID=A0A8S3V9K2_MYTED|nr:GLIPR1-like protein 1,Glioma pathogenesis-related protein 1 [Mytilus edulis]